MEGRVSDIREYRFTIKDLEYFASEMLGFFERKGITSKANLNGKLGIFDAEKGEIWVQGPPELKNRVYKISYLVFGRGTPIEVNVDLGHYSVVVECLQEIDEYDYDPSKENVGNLVQRRVLGRYWKSVEEGLKDLKD